jgi:acyl carrier protein
MSKSRESLLESITKAVSEIKTIDPSLVVESANLSADLGFGSIDTIDLFFEIGRETAIEISIPELYARINPGSSLPRRDFTVKEIIDFLMIQ